VTKISLVRLGSGLLVLAAVGTQLGIQVERDLSLVNFFSFFTNLSNLFAATVFLTGVRQRSTPRFDLLRWASAVNMTVVGIVFLTLLRGVDLGPLLPWVNSVLHYVMPVVVVAEWLFNPPRSQRERGDLAFVLIFPAAYLAYVLVRGALVDWYPYPFLDPINPNGYVGVAMHAVGIALLFVVAAWALMLAGNRLAESGQDNLG